MKLIPHKLILEVNDAISHGNVLHEDGSRAEDPLEGGWLSLNKKCIFPGRVQYVDCSAAIPIDQFGWSFSEKDVSDWKDFL